MLVIFKMKYFPVTICMSYCMAYCMSVSLFVCYRDSFCLCISTRKYFFLFICQFVFQISVSFFRCKFLRKKIRFKLFSFQKSFVILFSLLRILLLCRYCYFLLRRIFRSKQNLISEFPLKISQPCILIQILRVEGDILLYDEKFFSPTRER
jgi:hypothetical protein